VIGASGSGKSSAILAGLLPTLHTAHPKWRFLPPIVPNDTPLRTLTEALSSALPNKSVFTIQEELAHPSAEGLASLARQIVLQTPGERVVLYIDQFEEVFTRVAKDERQRFLNLLTTAASDARSPLTVILSLRADFYDRPLGYPLLAELVGDHHIDVLPMTLEELNQAIRQPAENVGLTFEEGLVGDLIFEVRGQEGALPLLQFTLTQLYDQREGRTLTNSAYQALGGVRGALAGQAEYTYQKLSAEWQRLARALFLRLIEPGATERETTRRCASSSCRMRRKRKLYERLQAPLCRRVC
jgi:Novel STAND NTPase 1